MRVRALRAGAVLTAGLITAAIGAGQSTAGALAAPATAPARATTAWLNGVSATSASNVWAVGAFGHAGGSAPLIEHWNGSKWTATKPVLNTDGAVIYYAGVSATAKSTAVAAGSWLIQYGLLYGSHWNGHKWSDDGMPIVGPDDGTAELTGVASVAGGHNWAVGYYFAGVNANARLTMILRWNASNGSWVRAKSPSPAGTDSGAFSTLNAVATDARADAWAVGDTKTGPSGQVNTLIEHWDGVNWKVAPSPDPTQAGCAEDDLNGVTASAAATWAVGNACGQPIVLRLSDGQWQAVSAPSAAKGAAEQLTSVAATSASNAWAVGQAGTRPLILRWNGTSWGKSQVAFPAGATSAKFSGVTAVSATSAWAVGQASYPGGKIKMLVEKWNGKNWTITTVQNPIP